MSEKFVGDVEILYSQFGFGELVSKIKNQPLELAEFLQFRMNLIREEMGELEIAYEAGDAVEFVDASIDLKVVLIGLLHLFEVNTVLAWNEVFRANSAKIPGKTERENHFGGDAIKSPGWVPPDHRRNLGLLPAAFSALGIENSKTTSTGKSLGKPFNVKDYPPYIQILWEFAEFAKGKNHDYNSKLVKHADYYPHGIDDIFYEIIKKVKRITSLLEIIRDGGEPQTDALFDSFRDISIFSAIAVAWIRGKIVGQNEFNDLFNREGGK